MFIWFSIAAGWGCGRLVSWAIANLLLICWIPYIIISRVNNSFSWPLASFDIHVVFFLLCFDMLFVTCTWACGHYLVLFVELGHFLNCTWCICLESVCAKGFSQAFKWCFDSSGFSSTQCCFNFYLDRAIYSISIYIFNFFTLMT